MEDHGPGESIEFSDRKFEKEVVGERDDVVGVEEDGLEQDQKDEQHGQLGDERVGRGQRVWEFA